MLQARVILALGAGLAVTVGLAACGKGSRPIENNVVRPGITAIEQSSALACSQDAATLQAEIDAFEAMEGRPPTDEADLIAVTEGKEFDRYNVVNGQIVPVAVDCGGTGAPAAAANGSAPMTAPATDLGEIVTSTDAPLTAEQMLAEFTSDEIAEVGGQECAGELASIFVASQNFVAEQAKDPQSLDDLTGYLDQPIDLWVVENDALVPAPGSGCVALEDSPPDQTARCRAEAKTLEVGREAYFAMTQATTEPTQADLVAAQMIRAVSEDVDLSNGTVVAVAGGACEGVDLGV